MGFIIKFLFLSLSFLHLLADSEQTNSTSSTSFTAGGINDKNNGLVINFSPIIEVDIKNLLKAAIKNDSQANSVVENESNQEMKVDNVVSNIQRAFDKYSEHKGKGWFVVIALIYSYLVYEIISIQSYLKDSERWALWRSELSLEGIYSIPDVDLLKDILLSIHRRYVLIGNAQDDFGAVKQFLIEAKEEKKVFKSYSRIVSFIKKLPLLIPKLFFVDYEVLNFVSLRQQRLNYFESKVHNWLSERKAKRCIEFLEISV